MTTVYYDDSHKKIVESGIPAIRRILFHNNTSEILSLLFCLDFYLDPYYKNTLSYEKEIYELLQELVISSQDDDIIEACLQLICIPLSILDQGFDKIKENWKYLMNIHQFNLILLIK